MAAIDTFFGITKAPLRIAGLGVLAAVIAGAALTLRGADPLPLPEMANSAVILSDGRQIYVQRFEVTVSEWNTCAADGGCALTLRTRPDQDPAMTPATGLSYIDALEYLSWINANSPHAFRLPTAVEWQTIAQTVLPEKSDPLFTDPSLTWASAYLTEGLTPRALKPQGSFSTSPEGVADLDGSVWEWTQECYAGEGEGIDQDRCPAFVVGGEHTAVMSYLVRDPARGGCAVGSPPAHLGMRLVTDEKLYN
jgi:formylglycine-generating enzyme required for sulfatase activity